MQDLLNKIFSFNDLTSTFGADLEMVANVMGLTGPNRLYFCPLCKIMLSNLVESVPHASILLYKYHNHGKTTPICYKNRTFEDIKGLSAEFKEAGAKKESAKLFKNCEKVPLLPAKGDVIEHVSVMPLHLSLAIGLQFLNTAENVAVSLDVQVREADGIIESYNMQCELEAEIQLINDDVAFTKEQIEIFFKQKREIESDKPQHLEKDNGWLKKRP